MQRRNVDFGFERAVIQRGFDFELFQFDVGAQGGKEVIGLRRHRAGGRLGQRGVLLERLVILFDLPPSLVEASQSLISKRRITADQIQNSGGAVFV